MRRRGQNPLPQARARPLNHVTRSAIDFYIEAGKIDTVLIYKIDRLTRSLPDFRQTGRNVRLQWRVLRLGHAAVQHHDLDETSFRVNHPALPRYGSRVLTLVPYPP